MGEEELIEIKFKIYDGSDLGPFVYSTTSTVDALKQRILSDWPKGKSVTPKSANEVKLISFGKIMENSKTVAQCNITPFGGALVMHAVVQPSLPKAKTAKKIENSPSKIGCSCSIL